MNDNDKRKAAVQYFWQLAQDSLVSARREFEHDSFVFAVNRIYYAAFYAASAALLERNLRFTKHAGVRSALHKELVRPGLLASNWGEFYDRVFENRQQGDYWPLVFFVSDDVKREIELCEAFLEAIRPLIRSLE